MEFSNAIEKFMLSYGMISIFVIVALEYANLPLPSEIVLPLAGILASEYNMNIILIIIISIVGGVIGSLTNYYLGYFLGNPLIYKLKNKYPKTKRAIKESYIWMAKYDNMSVMLSRLLPIARTVISIVAGVTRMKLLGFILYSSIGIAVWNTILILIGFFIGDNMEQISYILGTYSKIIAIFVVISFIIYIVTKKKKLHITNNNVTK